MFGHHAVSVVTERANKGRPTDSANDRKDWQLVH